MNIGRALQCQRLEMHAGIIGGNGRPRDEKEQGAQNRLKDVRPWFRHNTAKLID
jgi:hypothetical protein